METSEQPTFVRIRRERCQSHNACVRMAPDVFGGDAMGFVVLLRPGQPITWEQQDAVMDAVACCPEGVIEIANAP